MTSKWYFCRMDFGKLPSIDKVDFTLPQEPSGNAGVLAAGISTPRLYVGPTGYNMKAWVGKWYPPGAKEKDFLRHYTAQFNTIEFNTTHYRMPDPSSVLRWRREASEDFRFCPKIPQSISHSSDLGLSSLEPQIYCENIAGLGETLGWSFMQLPPHFSPKELPVLARFLAVYSKQTPLSVELRHPAFFKDKSAAEALFDLLREHRATAVITDVAGRRDVCHMHLTTSTTLIRFVGNGLHPSDYSRIQDWAERLRDWFRQGLQEAYFFTHEPDNLLGPELSAYCIETFGKALPEVSMRGPKPVPGQQASLFDF